MTDRIIAIGICTFQRPSLRETLESLARQNLPADMSLTLIIADNDDVPSAEAVVREFGARSTHVVEYIHAPARNISIARNAILDVARRAKAARLAFIDDDEIAQPDWIAQLDEVMTRVQADAVIGPVHAIYQDDAARWMQLAKVHDTMPEIGVDGRPIAGHSCNAMINCAAPAFSGLRFDLARGQTGGEDSAWFEAARRNGAQLAFAPDAIVREGVPPARAQLRWLVLRRYRMGQTYASLHHDAPSAIKRIASAAVAMAKTAWCALAALVQFPSPLARNRNIVRGAFHAGVIAHLSGLRQINLYGAPPRLPSPSAQGVRHISKRAKPHE
ncbi:glycosyltransferase [Thioclava sp.]|uniref:glycosyltransferase n=1 Tax=Thioclava sp. TaxID=1933450 RepID=UPI003AA9DD15